jgi:hypothetical protein
MAPNHAETQGARSDMKACGPWKGSGEGPLRSTLLLFHPILSRRPVSSPITSPRLLSAPSFYSTLLRHHQSISPLSHATQRPADRPRKGLGTDHIASAPLSSILYLFISTRLCSYRVNSTQIGSNRFGSSAHFTSDPFTLFPKPRNGPQRAGRQNRIASALISSRHITFYLSSFTSSPLASSQNLSSLILSAPIASFLVLLSLPACKGP